MTNHKKTQLKRRSGSKRITCASAPFWILDFFVVDPIPVFFALMIFLFRGKSARGEKIPLLLHPYPSKILLIISQNYFLEPPIDFCNNACFSLNVISLSIVVSLSESLLGSIVPISFFSEPGNGGGG